MSTAVARVTAGPAFRTPSAATQAVKWSRAALPVAYSAQYGLAVVASNDEMLTTRRDLAVALNVRKNHVLHGGGRADRPGAARPSEGTVSERGVCDAGRRVRAGRART